MTVSTEKQPLNGVDTATLFATLDAVKGQHDIAKFQFRASNEWVSGTHSRSRISGFYGAGQEMQHQQATTVESDHPAVLVGADNAPTPVEYLLHAIAACLTAGLANIAAARGVQLHKVTLHRRGRHRPARHPRAVRRSVRNGYQQIQVTMHIEGDADDETLRGLVEQSRRRSAVYDVAHQRHPRPHRRRHRLTPRPRAAVDAPTRPSPSRQVDRRPVPSTQESTTCPPSTPSSSARATPGWPSAACSPRRGTTTSSSTAAGSVERWRTERWDSLRLLTPAWMTPPPRIGTTPAPIPTASSRPRSSSPCGGVRRLLRGARGRGTNVRSVARTAAAAIDVARPTRCTGGLRTSSSRPARAAAALPAGLATAEV